jgi:multidrug efflux pump subunit AcrA (membrane-fusion protein)
MSPEQIDFMTRQPRIRRILTGGATLALLGLGFAACNSGKGQKAPLTAEQAGEAAPHTDEAAPAAGEEAGTISLSPEAQANIGLTVVAVEVRPIERTLLLNATLEVDPDREAIVSSRVPGKVLAVNARIGDRVTRGQPLVVLQSLQIAETPPKLEIPSPLDGVVLERTVTVGGTVDQTTALFRVADLSHILAQAEVYEADLGSARVGQMARLRVPAYPDRVFVGRVARLAGSIDPERRTLRVWIDLPNTLDRLLKPAMFGQIVLVLSRSGAAVTVPNEAVQTQGPERFVFVRNGSGFLRQPVVLGDRDDRYTSIQSGVIEGDEVVTRGAVELASVTSQAAAGGVQDESKPHSH